MKKAFIWSIFLIILDITIGTIAIEYFDVISLAEKYNEEIVHSMLLVLIGWFVVKQYKSLRFKEKTGKVNIQLVEG